MERENREYDPHNQIEVPLREGGTKLDRRKSCCHSPSEAKKVRKIRVAK